MMNEERIRAALGGGDDAAAEGGDEGEAEDPVTVAGRALAEELDLEGDQLDALAKFVHAVVEAG